MDHYPLRSATRRDGPAIVELNAAVEALTSPMDLARYKLLASQCDLLLVAENPGGDRQVGAFLMGFTAGSAYDSANYGWFDQRLKDFFYIDRVVVSAECRGLGVGQALYAEVIRQSRAAGRHWLAAEMNLEPPNPGSLAFHRKQGFVPVGQQVVGGNKVLSMQVRPLSGDDGPVDLPELPTSDHG